MQHSIQLLKESTAVQERSLSKYGKKINVRKMDAKYLKETSIEDNLRTAIYQGQLYNKEFAFALNVVVILKTLVSANQNNRDESPAAKNLTNRKENTSNGGRSTGFWVVRQVTRGQMGSYRVLFSKLPRKFDIFRKWLTH